MSGFTKIGDLTFTESDREQNMLSGIRARLEKRLRRWIPDNERVVAKEMKIFDEVVSRRDFLKAAGTLGSVMAFASLIDTGCGAPSDVVTQWAKESGEEIPPFLLTNADRECAQTVANIQASADLCDVLVTERETNASDARNYEAVLESLSTAPNVQETLEDGADTGFVELTRNHGTPEIVQLLTDEDGNQKLVINQYSPACAGLKQATIAELPPFTDPQKKYNKIVAANGAFHNTLDGDNRVLCQKMVAVAFDYNEYSEGDRDLSKWHKAAPEGYDTGDFKQQLMIYYQTGRQDQTMPGGDIGDAASAAGESDGWQRLDVMRQMGEFYKSRSQSISKYLANPLLTSTQMWAGNFVGKMKATIQDLRAYRDSTDHQFIYGTIKLNYFNNVCFVVDIDGNDQPVIRFFAPAELNLEAVNLLGEVCDKTMWGTLSVAELLALPQFRALAEMDLYHHTYDLLCTTNVGQESGPDYLGDLFLIYGGYNTDDIAIALSEYRTRFIVPVPSSVWGVGAVGLVRFFTFIRQGSQATVALNKTFPRFEFRYATPPSADIYDAYPSLIPTIMSQTDTMPMVIRKAETSIEVVSVAALRDQGSIFLKQVRRRFHCEDGTGRLAEISGSAEDTLFDSDDYDRGKDDGYPGDWVRCLTGKQTLWEVLLGGHVTSPDGSRYPEIEPHITINHQNLLRVFFKVNTTLFDGVIGVFEEGNQSEGQAYVRGALSAEVSGARVQWSEGALPTMTGPLPLQVSIPGAIKSATSRLLPWQRRYLNAGEAVGVFPKNERKTVSGRPSARSAGAEDEQAYYYAVANPFDYSWKRYALDITPSAAQVEVTVDSHVVRRHLVSLQLTNCYNQSVAPSENTYVEIRAADQCNLRNVTYVDTPVSAAVNRVTGYMAKPDAAGTVKLQIALGAEQDLLPGTTLYYRIVNSNSLVQAQGSPTVRLATSVQDTTTDWKCFNISYRTHDRMSSDQMRRSQLPGQDSPYDRMSDNFNPEYVSEKDNILNEVASGYGTAGSAGRPDNATLASIAGLTSREPVNPLVHVLGAPGAAAQGAYIQGKKWLKWLNPVNWVRELAKAAKEVFNWVIDKVKEIINTILEGIANALDTLGFDNLADAVRRLEDVINTVLNTLQTIVNILLDILIALFDFGTAFQIGRALKQISASCLDTNSGFMKLYKDWADTAVDSIRETFDLAEEWLDKVFGTDLAELDRGPGGKPWYMEVNSPEVNTQASTFSASVDPVHMNYAQDQITMSLPPESLSQSLAVFAENRSAGVLPGGLAWDGIWNRFKPVMPHIRDMAVFAMKGDWQAVAGAFNSLIRDLIQICLDMVESGLTTIVQVPVILADGIRDAINSESEGIFKPIFKILNFLFEGCDFKNGADVFFFLVGFPLNIMSAAVAGTSKALGREVNMARFIIDELPGKFDELMRKVANAASGQSWSETLGDASKADRCESATVEDEILGWIVTSICCIRIPIGAVTRALSQTKTSGPDSIGFFGTLATVLSVPYALAYLYKYAYAYLYFGGMKSGYFALMIFGILVLAVPLVAVLYGFLNHVTKARFDALTLSENGWFNFAMEICLPSVFILMGVFDMIMEHRTYSEHPPLCLASLSLGGIVSPVFELGCYLDARFVKEPISVIALGAGAASCSVAGKICGSVFRSDYCG